MSVCVCVLTHPDVLDLSVQKVEDLKSPQELKKVIHAAIASKQYGHEDLLGELVTEAALNVMPKNIKDFNVDSIRVVKVMGSSLYESKVVKGMVFGREPEGIIQNATKAKVAVFTCPLDIQQTETKGTVLIHNAQEMLNFSKDEEKHIEKVRTQEDDEDEEEKPDIYIFFFLFFFFIDLPRAGRCRRQGRCHRQRHWRARVTLPQPLQHHGRQGPLQV